MPNTTHTPATVAGIEAYLTRQCLKFGPDRMEHYKTVATHEAAHIVAGLACRAAILEVEINPPRTTKSALGGVNVSGLLPHHDAIIWLVGWAWEEAHGNTRNADGDMRGGKGEDAENFDRNLTIARRFVLDAEPVIKACAAAVMWGVNKRGKLPTAKLHKIMDYIRPHALKHAHLIGQGHR